MVPRPAARASPRSADALLAAEHGRQVPEPETPISAGVQPGFTLAHGSKSHAPGFRSFRSSFRPNLGGGRATKHTHNQPTNLTPTQPSKQPDSQSASSVCAALLCVWCCGAVRCVVLLPCPPCLPACAVCVRRLGVSCAGRGCVARADEWNQTRGTVGLDLVGWLRPGASRGERGRLRAGWCAADNRIPDRDIWDE